MNIILSNPAISEFLSSYPKEKHTNCLLGIILLGIYNLKAFSINFEEILSQIESKQSLNAEKLSMSSFKKPEDNKNNVSSPGLKPEDTPRFVDFELRNEQRSLSSQRLQEKPTSFLKKERKVNQKIFKMPRNDSLHWKTPSIVNPEITSNYITGENSEVLRIADQFLNGRFAVEYCKMDKDMKKNVPKIEISKKIEENNIAKNSGFANSNSSYSGRRNSFSVGTSRRLTRGDRNSSYSKFW